MTKLACYQAPTAQDELGPTFAPWLSMKNSRTWLLTAAFVVAPLIGVGIVLYGLGHAAVGRRPKPAAKDPYSEWLALRQLVRARGSREDAAPRN